MFDEKFVLVVDRNNGVTEHIILGHSFEVDKNVKEYQDRKEPFQEGYSDKDLVMFVHFGVEGEIFMPIYKSQTASIYTSEGRYYKNLHDPDKEK